VFHCALASADKLRHPLDKVPNLPLTVCCGTVLRLVGFTYVRTNEPALLAENTFPPTFPRAADTIADNLILAMS